MGKFWGLKYKQVISSSINLDHESSTNPTKSANLLPKHSSLVFNRTIASDSQITQPNSPPIYPTFFFYDEFSVLKNLKNNHYNGPNSISASLLYNCCYSLVIPLFRLYKNAFDSGIFLAFGSQFHFKIWWPIQYYQSLSCILPHLSKIFEFILFNNIKKSCVHWRAK